MTSELQDNILKYTFSLAIVKKFSPIRPTVQKIIRDKLVTDRQTTDNRQTDIFELTLIHKGN
jgi:hypothetical protein